MKSYLNQGLSESQYEQALKKVDLHCFDETCFMRSSLPDGEKTFSAIISKLISGIESSGTSNASGLFSEISS